MPIEKARKIRIFSRIEYLETQKRSEGSVICPAFQI